MPKNYTKKELAALKAKQTQKKLEQDHAEPSAAIDLSNNPDAWSGLTDRQVRIQTFRLRGLSQSKIANIMGLSQATISNELKALRKVHQEKGTDADAGAVAGEAITVFEEVEHQAWGIFSKSTTQDTTKLQALNVIMSSREKQLKLLMDLGLIQQAAQQVDHTIQVKSSFLENWEKTQKEELANAVLSTGLNELPPPEPMEEDEDYEDADFEDTD